MVAPPGPKAQRALPSRCLRVRKPIKGGCRAPVRIIFTTSRLLLFADFEPPPSAEFIVRWLDESLRGLALAGNGARARARAAAEGELSFSPALPHAVALRCRAIRAAASRLCEWAEDALEGGEQPEPMSRFTTDRLAAEAPPPVSMLTRARDLVVRAAEARWGNEDLPGAPGGSADDAEVGEFQGALDTISALIGMLHGAACCLTAGGGMYACF